MPMFSTGFVINWTKHCSGASILWPVNLSYPNIETPNKIVGTCNNFFFFFLQIFLSVYQILLVKAYKSYLTNSKPLKYSYCFFFFQSFVHTEKAFLSKKLFLAFDSFWKCLQSLNLHFFQALCTFRRLLNITVKSFQKSKFFLYFID